MRSLGVYAALFRLPGARRAALPALLARTTYAMAGLSILLLVHARTGSFARGGLATAAYSLASAAAGPWWGRRIDRIGPARALLPLGVAFPAALGLLLAVAGRSPWTLPCAALAGALLPQIGAAMRASWSSFTTDEGLLAAAYGMESVLVEVVYTVGPLLVGGLVAFASPVAAVAVAAATAGIGTLGFCTAPGLPGGGGRGARHRRSHPLRVPAVGAVAAAAVLQSCSFGALEVAVPGFASERGSSALGGVLLAAWAIGSMLGGTVYGARVWPAGSRWADPARRYLVLLALAAVTALPVVGAPGTVALGIALLVSGLTIAPTGTEQFGLVARATPPGTTTEAFTWLSTTVTLGAAAGNAAAGAVQDAYGSRAGLGVGAAAGVASLVVALALRGRLPHGGRATRELVGVGAPAVPRAPVL